MIIPSAVLHHFAADPVGPMLTLVKEAENPGSPVYSEIEDLLSSIDIADVAETRHNPSFRHFHSTTVNLDRAARIWIAWQRLCQAIAEYRLNVLRQDSRSDRPRPYNHPALQDLTPDAEHLLPLRHFDFDGTRLVRNGHAFLMLSTTGAPNSTYWLIQACHSNDVRDHMRVRLDPLLHGPAREFRPPYERMLVYGPPLDWNRIEHLRRTEHGQWWPDRRDGKTQCTEYAWQPHGSEVTFLCEEVPALAAAPCRPGRYFHSIYLPSEAAVCHIDAAVRIYTNSEIAKRHSHHVRNVGKIGLRAKVFRVDGLLSRTVLSSLCQSFLVWNQDVCRYFKNGCK